MSASTADGLYTGAPDIAMNQFSEDKVDWHVIWVKIVFRIIIFELSNRDFRSRLLF